MQKAIKGKLEALLSLNVSKVVIAYLLPPKIIRQCLCQLLQNTRQIRHRLDTQDNATMVMIARSENLESKEWLICNRREVDAISRKFETMANDSSIAWVFEFELVLRMIVHDLAKDAAAERTKLNHWLQHRSQVWEGLRITQGKSIDKWDAEETKRVFALYRLIRDQNLQLPHPELYGLIQHITDDDKTEQEKVDLWLKEIQETCDLANDKPRHQRTAQEQARIDLFGEFLQRWNL